jgi:alkylation response protein AidB-like acyl-CoA dehydrogenase
VGRAWPREFGGGGRPPVEQIVVDQELAAAGAPEFVNVVGLDVLGPSLLRFGTQEQRARHIPPILDASEIWCQGFSEPEAGSDLASLRTKATGRDGDFVISGQKTWVSWGQFARWCGVLARTEPPSTGDTVPPHRGISMLIVDMTSPGVVVRPMTQITGHAEFCEVFFDDVLVPGQNLLSARGDGWKIAMYTLGHERGTAALPRQVKLRTWLDRLAATTARRELDGRPLLDEPQTQAALAQAMIGIEVLRYHAERTVGEFLSGGAVGPDSSSVKLLMAEAEQRLAATAVGLLGPVMEHAAGSEDDEDAFWEETYLYSRAASVYGGTRQIQRNIIADRVLALPQE